MHHPMKRPIVSGLTAFWLNGETEACATCNGHIVLPVSSNVMLQFIMLENTTITSCSGLLKLWCENTEAFLTGHEVIVFLT